MEQMVSKTQFMAKISKYLLIVEEQKVSLIITHRGKPVLRIIPHVAKN